MRPYLSCAPLMILLASTCLGAADDPIPHAQSKPPGPALSPSEAIKKMKVPDGFTVEVVACEPDIVNPVSMTFDERGRVWITESLEYPRSEPGKGQDRIKILEDTDGDGRMDKFTIFAEGLNIPSGIALGHGGVWVGNAPDILFLKDTNGDDKADETKVIVSGFGRLDTHELPNSFTWGPDGYLYGLNGVFNQSQIANGGRDFKFTCAMFRINPRNGAFELFAEGTSNPWGIAFDSQGSAFVSACVIDHLWHIAETGYYHRQAGEYPPFTWKIGSIVDYKHQQAAYCGLHYFDSDAYPAAYRDRLYMGNIHGNCVNVDALKRDGSTYRGTPNDDFLTANDAWFMTVAQKTGPDGCLWVLDWYDRYHCYQDARRDPKGIDRLKGRLYRVRYKDSPRAPKFDLVTETDDQLIERLGSPNIFFRDMAQRLLSERKSKDGQAKLQSLVLSQSASLKTRMHALWSLVGRGPLEPDFHLNVLTSNDPGLRAWGVRAAGNAGKVEESVRVAVAKCAEDESPDVLLQLAIASRKIDGVDPLGLLVDVAARSGDDKLIPHIVWQNLHPLLGDRGKEFITLAKKYELKQHPNLAKLMPKAAERMLTGKKTGDTR